MRCWRLCSTTASKSRVTRFGRLWKRSSFCGTTKWSIATWYARPVSLSLSFSPHKNAILQKPENVLLTAPHAKAQIKLADFGLAVQLLPGEKLKEGVGTPNYIAPEVLQCLEDEDEAAGYDFSCDTWSAGCILHILLCGKTPFGHIEDTDEMYEAILEGSVALDSPEWAHVSAEAKELVRGLLTVDPSQRVTGGAVLASPWMTRGQLEQQKLPGTHAELKNFNAKRRWKSSILAVMATNRVKTLGDMRGAAERKRSKQEQQ